MLSRFVTETHLVKSIGVVEGRGLFIVLIRNYWVWLDFTDSNFVYPTQGHHRLGVTKLCALDIQVYCLLYTLGMTTARKEKRVSFEAKVLTVDEVSIASINIVIAIHKNCDFGLCFSLCICICSISSLTWWVVLHSRVCRFCLFGI